MLITISVMLIGLGQGSSISLALTLLGLRAANPKESAELSGMAQSLGYAFAATGPVLIGFFLDMTGSPFVPLFIFVGIVVVMVVAGLAPEETKQSFKCREALFKKGASLFELNAYTINFVLKVKRLKLNKKGIGNNRK